MQNEDNADKLTQARSSRDSQRSLIRRFYQNFCSCVMPCLYKNEKQIHMGQNTPYQKGQLQAGSQLRDSKNQKSLVSEPNSVAPGSTSWSDKKQFLFRSVYLHAARLLQQYDESLDKSTIKKWHSYSIYQYRQNQLQLIGTSKGRILCKITCVRVQPSAVSKKKTNQSRSYERFDRFTTSNFDNYWNKRYMLFEKFDEGISLDDQSWYSVTPQSVAQHIAQKIRCDTVLDGFCGAGGNAIKLANTCYRVIANDICRVKLKCLQTNAKIYCAQNIEMLNQDFLQLEGIQPDVIFLAPPFGPEQKLKNQTLPSQMSPPLNKIFAKAISMSRNIVMLLPPNINVQKLGELIAEQYIASNIPSSTCSIKIQKIMFMSQLKYLAVYIGSMIQNQINLNDELCYIYNYLKQGQKKIFNQKKIIRYLRQKHGMINLLNFVFKLDQIQKSGTLIQKLHQLIKQKKLIEQQKFRKLVQEQNIQLQIYNKKKIPLIQQKQIQKQIMEEQKYVGDEKQATLSYYSQNSGNKGARDSKMFDSVSQRLSVQTSTEKQQQVYLEQIPRSNTQYLYQKKLSIQSQIVNNKNSLDQKI